MKIEINLPEDLPFLKQIIAVFEDENEQPTKSAPKTKTKTKPKKTDTKAAFSKEPPEINLKDAGAFMRWCSEKQVDGSLAQEDVRRAYEECALEVTDLFPPRSAAEIEINITKLYDILKGIIDVKK